MRAFESLLQACKFCSRSVISGAKTATSHCQPWTWDDGRTAKGQRRTQQTAWDGTTKGTAGWYRAGYKPDCLSFSFTLPSKLLLFACLYLPAFLFLCMWILYVYFSMYDLDHVAHFLLNLITETYADMVTWRCYFRNNDFLHGLCLNFIIYIHEWDECKKTTKIEWSPCSAFNATGVEYISFYR